MWRGNFQKVILERGYQYFQEGRCGNLVLGPDTVLAGVRGEKDYQVSIGHIAGIIVQMRCTCPYAQNSRSCKHMAAVLHAWESWGQLNTAQSSH